MILFEHHYIVSSVYICSVSAHKALGLKGRTHWADFPSADSNSRPSPVVSKY